MRVANEVNLFEPKAARHKYEILRANALGNANRAVGFSVFLRHGMSSWLRTLTEQNCIGQEIQPELSTFSKPKAGIHACGLASIITDAILNAAGTATPFGGAI